MSPTANVDSYFAMLGMKARDRVTGYEGRICSVSFDLFGCVQFTVHPPVDKDGKVPDGRYFDASRLEVTDPMHVMQVPHFAPLPSEHKKGPAERPSAGRR